MFQAIINSINTDKFYFEMEQFTIFLANVAKKLTFTVKKLSEFIEIF